jgi:hypothetical protein
MNTVKIELTHDQQNMLGMVLCNAHNQIRCNRHITDLSREQAAMLEVIEGLIKAVDPRLHALCETL